MNIANYLRKLVYEKGSLTETEAEEIANAIMKGEITEIQSAGVLVALASKGESSEEIRGFARAMRNNAIRIDFPNTLDTAGTGGDGLNTLNVSTATALVLSQVFPVAKHGNRSVSSKSGSADVLEELGYKITVEKDKAIELLTKSNFVFLFAPLYHPAMKNVANVRKNLGIRTIFNILGPLTNPASARYQMMGVFSEKFIDRIAEAAQDLDYERMYLYHGEPGIDEISPQGDTIIYEVNRRKIERYKVNYTDFGIKEPVPIEKLRVESTHDSAVKIIRGLSGLDKNVKTFIAINVSVGLRLLGKVTDFRDGYEYAIQLMESSIGHIEKIIELNGNIERFRGLVSEAGKG
ncbi:anthranilate phosphoribosyltransferase [Stygiolobus caldivivus]|uniref:Anthranilate phosphoribosyltransferase n=1 Tax=Stygiolobus caldivivus TaxID=2824673 RepID=A0A8D5ZJ52_9CREN|nr:anthranilate phosphoribosyltransferase [Stygiolobus caldivivus]BCU71204.1 anthranilate phosphoribosyltransferase [Stygiolobus caldivivus]